VDAETEKHAQVVLDLAIQLAKDQLGLQFSAFGSLDGKFATILGFTAVFACMGSIKRDPIHRKQQIHVSALFDRECCTHSGCSNWTLSFHRRWLNVSRNRNDVTKKSDPTGQQAYTIGKLPEPRLHQTEIKKSFIPVIHRKTSSPRP